MAYDIGDSTQYQVVFTESAARKVHELIVDEGNYDLKLRVYITGGGCSGFQYGFTFDETVQEGDVQITRELDLSEEDDEAGDAGEGGHATVTLLIDPMSYQYLNGAEIDFSDDISGEQFIIRNPNAKTTCGCGSSFSI